MYSLICQNLVCPGALKPGTQTTYVPSTSRCCNTKSQACETHLAVQSGELHSGQNIISEFTPECPLDFKLFIGFQTFLHSPEISFPFAPNLRFEHWLLVSGSWDAQKNLKPNFAGIKVQDHSKIYLEIKHQTPGSFAIHAADEASQCKSQISQVCWWQRLKTSLSSTPSDKC